MLRRRIRAPRIRRMTNCGPRGRRLSPKFISWCTTRAGGDPAGGGEYRGWIPAGGVDLRYSAPQVKKPSDDDGENFPDAADMGPLVLAGSYSVRMFSKVGGAVTELAGPQSFKVTTEGASGMSAADRTAGRIHAEGDTPLPGSFGGAAYR